MGASRATQPTAEDVIGSQRAWDSEGSYRIPPQDLLVYRLNDWKVNEAIEREYSVKHSADRARMHDSLINSW